jgi:transcriptional regulator with XRE-family HTH domain
MVSAGQAFRNIRRRLGVTQKEIARAMNCTVTNVGFYERGQTVPPPRAKLLIAFAREKGLAIGYEHVYEEVQLPEIPRTGVPA